MRNTDYFVGIHGAGLSLSIYAPKNCIYHEVLHSPNMNGLELFAALSGHKVYKDIIVCIYFTAQKTRSRSLAQGWGLSRGTT